MQNRVIHAIALAGQEVRPRYFPHFEMLRRSANIDKWNVRPNAVLPNHEELAVSLPATRGSQPEDKLIDGERRQVRADAQANADKLLLAAAAVFAEYGVDAPARTVAARAEVGVGTLYRHFPKRSILIAEVFRNEVDACAAAAPAIATRCGDEYIKALTAWLHRYMDFIVSKRGLSAALHSGDPAFADLHDYFDRHLGPALDSLLAPAINASEVRADVSSHTILHAVRSLCIPDDDGRIDHVRPVIDLLIDGLRFGALTTQTPTTALGVAT